jgi:hypothetical protein
VLLKDNYTVMTTTHTFLDPTGGTSKMSTRFSLEFLKGCAYKCPGCFVQRDNDYSPGDLDIVKNAVDEFQNNGTSVDEIILGPTDFFAADNTEQLLLEPKFQSIFQGSDKTLIVFSTLKDSYEKIDRYMSILDEKYRPLGADLEILVIFELQKVLSGDQEYISELKRKIQFFNQYKLDVDYALQLNIQNINTSDIDLVEITKIVRDEFDTCVEFNPSFLRTGQTKLTHAYLKSWKDFLSSHINPGNTKDILLSMANPNHAGFSEDTYNFADGEFYIAPFIYENVFDRTAPFKIKKSNGKTYRYQDFTSFREQSNVEQFAYVNKLDDCRECPHSFSCVGKHVIHFMEHNQIDQCPLPKDVFDMYATVTE